MAELTGDLTAELFNSSGFTDINLLDGVIDSLSPQFDLLKLAIEGDTAQIKASFVPGPQLIVPISDLHTSDYAAVKTASIATTGTEGIAKTVLSFDKGITWKTFKDGTWQDIELTTEAVSTEGILHNQLSAIPEEKWSELLGETLRLAYYLEKTSEADNLAVDTLTIQADMKDSWGKAIPGADYSYEYTGSQLLNVKLLQDGSYKINISVAGKGSTAIAPGDVSQLVAKAGNGKVTLKWSDPQDVVLNGATLCKWAGTKVVCKQGSFPIDEMDGTLVTDNLVRDQYVTDGLAVTGLTNGTAYYFALFPYSDTGATNKNAGNQVSATPNIYRTMTVKIDLANSDPATCCSYADDAAGMEPRSADWDEFFGHYPVLFKDGKEVGRLNPDDFTKFVDGTSADITSGSAGDVMIAFPRRGLKIDTEGDTLTISMTEHPNHPEFAYLAHSRGDKKREVFYLGAYKGFQDSANKLRSLSEKVPTQPLSIQVFRTQAQANGLGYENSGFYQLTFRQAMYLLKYANLNSQVALGMGYVNNQSPTNTGGTETKGMDWGETSGLQHMKLFGMEDFWGNICECIDGVTTDSKQHILTATTDFNDEGIGYIDQNATTIWLKTGYMAKPQGTAGAGFITREFGDRSTGFCDYSGVAYSCYAVSGGSNNSGTDSGAFYLTFQVSPTYSGARYGARLMYL